MTVRKQAALGILIGIALLVAVLYGISSRILLGGFAQVENDNAQQNVERAVQAISAESAYLNNKASDWANWDDTYAFIEDGNSEYAESNLTNQAFGDLSIDVMLFVKTSGEVVAARAYDRANDHAAQVPQALLDRLSPDDVLLQLPAGENSRTGLLLLPEGNLLVVSRPILTSLAEGPSRGHFIIGRYLDAELVAQLAETTHLSLEIQRVSDTGLPPDFALARSSMSSAPNFVHPLDEQTIAGYTILNDLDGRPALMLRVTTPRPIYAQGQATMRYIFWALLAVTLFSGAVAMVLVDRIVRSWQKHKESEERFRAVTESANDAIIAADRNGKIVSWNHGAREMFGYDGGEALSRPIASLLPEIRSHPAPDEATYETVAIKNDGVEFPVEVSPATWATQRGVFSSYIIRDITERKRAEAALRESEAKHRTLIEEMPAVTYLAAADGTGALLYVSPQIETMLGFTPQEWISDPELWVRQMHPEDRERSLAEYAATQKNATPFQTEYRTLHRDGSVVWVRHEATLVEDGAGQARLWQGLVQDISDRKRAEWALQESEERYSLAVRGANDGLWDWNLETDRVYYSPRWKSMLGYGADELGSSKDEWLTRVHPDDDARFDAELAAHLAGNTPYLESEHRVQHRDGHYIYVLARGLAVRGPDGRAHRMAGSLSDITVRKRAEEQLLHDAFHDALTGLPNRALFVDRLGHAIERSRRHPESRFAVLYLDFDRFKVVNDSFGHNAGDQLLIAGAQRLQLCMRSADTVARLGGDEFVILSEDIDDIRDAVAVADRIQNEMALPFQIEGHQIFTSISTGVVVSGIQYQNPEEILRDADIAMYRAKALGKSRFEVFDAALRDQTMARLELETDLHAAIEQQQLRVHYQPIMSLEDDRIVGFEALVRWKHPQRGLVPPGDFIPIAEETGLIIPLGDWVLRQACRQVREWQSRFAGARHLTVSVNLSAKQFAQANLADQIAAILRETGLDPHSLRLEITETVIMEDATAGAITLEHLQALGIEVQIDDFGTGYSSLSYLQQFPINTLKIDRSFISRLHLQGHGQGTSLEIVKTIVTLARQLGLKVVAEGIETEEQLGGLKEMDCEFGQGYLISKPLPPDQIETLVSALRESC